MSDWSQISHNIKMFAAELTPIWRQLSRLLRTEGRTLKNIIDKNISFLGSTVDTCFTSFVVDKLLKLDQRNLYTKNVKCKTTREKWFEITDLLRSEMLAFHFFHFENEHPVKKTSINKKKIDKENRRVNGF